MNSMSQCCLRMIVLSNSLLLCLLAAIITGVFGAWILMSANILMVFVDAFLIKKHYRQFMVFELTILKALNAHDEDVAKRMLESINPFTRANQQ